MSLPHHDARREAFVAAAALFRDDFFDCLTVRGDTLFELTDVLLCADCLVTTPVDLTLAAEHRRGHGTMYARSTAGPSMCHGCGRYWSACRSPRPPTAVSSGRGRHPLAPAGRTHQRDRLFCHVYGRSGRSSDQYQFVPGWPYSFIAALEVGRISW